MKNICSITHHTGCDCWEESRNEKIENLKKENARIRNALIYLINMLTEDHSSPGESKNGQGFKKIWNESMKLGNATKQSMIGVKKAKYWECTNCGYLNLISSGPCFGCKLSSPRKKEIEEIE